MTAVLGTEEYFVRDSDSILKIERYGPYGEKSFGRHLTLDGRRAYLLTTLCDTCPFLFERSEGANQSVDVAEFAETLRAGLSELDPSVIEAASRAMPDGRYRVALLDVMPKLVWPGEDDDYFTHEQLDLWEIDPFWGLPNSPRVPYFRTADVRVSDHARLFEFVVPMFPPRWGNEEAVADYSERASRGEHPTALSLSILDVRQPADWEGDPEIDQHWCLAHFIADGNHRVYGAAEAGKPARLLSFVSDDWSVASWGEIEEALALLAADNYSDRD
jgi:hypothetical protein